MSVGPIAERLARNATERDLVELIPLALAVVARIHEVRAVGESGRAQEVRTALPQQSAENVEDAAERVSPTRQRRGLERLEERPGRNAHLHQIVEAVVEQDLRVEH